MARIRIIDEWLRSPVDRPTRSRVVMVVAELWAEQRVLLRAYAGCMDQTRPTIELNGRALSIGPAGIDPHGAWGLHVDTAVDGHAQALRDALVAAARRLAGARGNPPRLADEESELERKPTSPWTPDRARSRSAFGPDVVGDEAAATRDLAPSSEPAPIHAVDRRASVFAAAPSESAALRGDAPPVQVAIADPDARTVLPFGELAPPGELSPGRAGAPASGAVSAGTRRRRTPTTKTGVGAPPRRRRAPRSRPPAAAPSASADPLGEVVGRTLPLGFRLTRPERAVVDALGARGLLDASEIAEIAEVEDGAAWARGLMAKLAEHGLDLIEPGAGRAGVATFALRAR
jgi:hypothetical protein